MLRILIRVDNTSKTSTYKNYKKWKNCLKKKIYGSLIHNGQRYHQKSQGSKLEMEAHHWLVISNLIKNKSFGGTMEIQAMLEPYELELLEIIRIEGNNKISEVVVITQNKY